ncbi:MAG: hypothetical protein KJ062_16015 [Thermoanaerobaculia bacterium]|nr:hypothetical protein [Thermoanaerobaculia bacterium]
MTTKPPLLALLLLFAAFDAIAELPAPSPIAGARPAVGAALADVSFVAGRWLSADKEPFSEETGSPPAGASLVGMWRLSAKGRARVFELLTLLEEEGKVVLRLRHFDRRGVAWEEKDAPLVLPLVAKGERLAVFEGRDGEAFLRLTYRGESGGLVVTLEKGTEAAQVYRFLRAAPE